MVAERGLGVKGDLPHRHQREGMVIRVVTREGILIQIPVDLGLRRGHGYLPRKGDFRTRGCVGLGHRRRLNQPCPGED